MEVAKVFGDSAVPAAGKLTGLLESRLPHYCHTPPPKNAFAKAALAASSAESQSDAAVAGTRVYVCV